MGSLRSVALFGCTSILPTFFFAQTHLHGSIFTPEKISYDVIDFAEDFFHLSVEDVVNLPGDKFKALAEFEHFFGDGISLKKLEIIRKDGFGESLDDMFDNARGGSLIPKLARDYVEKKFMASWDELPPMDLNYFGDRDYLFEAYEEKYGPLD